MSVQINQSMRWTTADLELLPDDGSRYEIIDGELFVTRSPHIRHQTVCVKMATQLEIWSNQTGLGVVIFAPGIIFTDADNVIPDVIWVSKERLEQVINEAGHLTGAPELVIEVLSPGADQERRDKQLKLRLYSVQGVHEYWIADGQKQQIEVYRRENAALRLVMTLYPNDTLTSPLLPEFSCKVSRIFS
jgi:Uma2 family endonuclease